MSTMRATYTYKESAGTPREVDVFFPANHNVATDRVPGILLFHGGGWRGGDKFGFHTACAHFAQRGLVAATANYAMLDDTARAALAVDQTRKRVCITDVKSAIRWMRTHAAELGVEHTRLISGGGSAGAHSAILATLNPGLNDPDDPPDVSTHVAAFLLFNPAFDPDDSHDPEVDVMSFIAGDFPPAIAFFGTEDRWKAGWDSVCARLAAHGNTDRELWLADGQSHAFFNREPWTSLTIAEADRFLVRQGFLSGPTPAPVVEGQAELQRR